MKSRNREINIFNMSLLDILCGALGTFCFLMLTLLPYYSGGGRGNEQQQLTEVLQEIERLKSEGKGNASTGDIAPFLVLAAGAALDPGVTAKVDVKLVPDRLDPEMQSRMSISEASDKVTLLPQIAPGEYPLNYFAQSTVPFQAVGFMCDWKTCTELPAFDVRPSQSQIPAGSITIQADGRAVYHPR